MIKNDQQRRITEEKLDGLRQRLTRLRKKYPADDDYNFYAAATQRQIQQMTRELELFDTAKRGDVDALIRLWNEHGRIHPKEKDDLALGDLVSLLRVARGLSQAQLADSLGVEQSHIARYERDDYTGYTVDTLDRLFTALGVRFTLGKLELPKAA